jgi:4-azaleucine resistance transporter AzlC
MLRAAGRQRAEERSGQIRTDLGLEPLAAGRPGLLVVEVVVDAGEDSEVPQEKIVALHRVRGSIAVPAADTQPAQTYRDGVRAIAPIAPIAFVFGISFGVLAEAAGMGRLAPVVMSLTTFAGSSQFAAASFFEAGGGIAAGIGAAILLNARYAPISLTVALGGSLPRRLVLSQLIVDESWAVSHVKGRVATRRLIGAGCVLYVCWTAGTVLGVLVGDVLGDPETYGLDAAFPALFLALLIPQIRSRTHLAAALLGAAIALALVPFTSPGVPIIAASAACLVGLRR